MNVVIVNISVNDELSSYLTDDYLSAMGIDQRKNEVALVEGLYISKTPKDEALAYTSTMKLIAMIEAKQADVVIADEEAMEIIRQNGYLSDADDILTVKLDHFGYAAKAYAGIIANTPRPTEAKNYLELLRNI